MGDYEFFTNRNIETPPQLTSIVQPFYERLQRAPGIPTVVTTPGTFATSESVDIEPMTEQVAAESEPTKPNI